MFFFNDGKGESEESLNFLCPLWAASYILVALTFDWPLEGLMTCLGQSSRHINVVVAGKIASTWNS